MTKDDWEIVAVMFATFVVFIDAFYFLIKGEWQFALVLYFSSCVGGWWTIWRISTDD